MRLKRIIFTLIGACLVLFVVFFVGVDVFRDRLFDTYVQRLDRWVDSGGNLEAIEVELVGPCSDLIWSQTDGWFERLKLFVHLNDRLNLFVHRHDADYRIDICLKMTANRKHPQPIFENKEIVAFLCDKPTTGYEYFRQLCRRSGLRS